jgi:penicillin-binding protein 2
MAFARAAAARAQARLMYVRDDLRPVHRRIAIALAIVCGLFIALLLRLWFLQVLGASHWRQLAENNRLRRIPLEAPRGQVTDIHGGVLLTNRPTFQLLIFPEEISDPARTVAFLVRIGIAPRAEVEARLDKALRTSHLPSVIADNLTWAQMATVAAHRADYRELEVHQSTRRALPDGLAVAHLAGQLGEVTAPQLAADPSLRPGQLIGRSGIEQAYEGVLGGKPGRLVVVVDALGRQVSTLREEPPTPGKPLRVTIDLALQLAAVRAMDGQVGAVVALDPREGAVRVLLSQPAFDPDLFAGHLEPSRWHELLANPLRPLNDRALQALYPPGSTIKPLFAAGALRDGVRTVGQSIYCSGDVTIFGHPYRCWQRGGHGRVDLVNAIEESCDSYFYLLARDAGLDRLAAWARLFGLGTPTGIELPGENGGLVPDEGWSERVRGHPWYAGETISVGIGQGPILVTPLQLAVAYAALVNGGYLVHPHLGLDVVTPPTPLDIDPRVLAAVRTGMERVVHGSRGTARGQAGAPVPFGGKTGTSQVVAKKEGVHWQELPWEQRHHALFVGFAPLGDPTLVVAVVVEHGGDAASVAAPIAAQVFAAAFGDTASKGTVVASRADAGARQAADQPPVTTDERLPTNNGGPGR